MCIGDHVELKYFISAGEPSGDLHAANLARELMARDCDARVYGFGGDHMTAAGCQLLFPMTRLAVMWFARVLVNLHRFLDLASRADRFFARERPDAVILVDYPGFNWWMARRAHARGIPVFYFVPPQIWAWFTWRIKKMRRWVDHVICCLPFEEAWYHERGVSARYVGHPFFDDLAARTVDSAFCEELRQSARGPIVGLLPGSRTQEVTKNFPTMLAAARRLREAKPNVTFPVACFRERHRELAEGFARQAGVEVDLYVDKTAEIIRAADAVIAVSGSVGLEILYYTTPAVVLYRIGKIDLPVGEFFKKSKYISIINLLADDRVVPEYLTSSDVSPQMVADLLPILDDPAARQAVVDRLADLKTKYAQPGATARAAEEILDRICGTGSLP